MALDKFLKETVGRHNQDTVVKENCGSHLWEKLQTSVQGSSGSPLTRESKKNTFPETLRFSKRVNTLNQFNRNVARLEINYGFTKPCTSTLSNAHFYF